MIKQICNKCKIEKVISDFRFRKDKNYYRKICKKCECKTNLIYRENNKEKVKIKTNKWEKENKERRRLKREEWKLKNPDYYSNYNKKYNQNNKEKIRNKNKVYQKNKYNTDINYKLRMLIGGRIRRILNQNITRKNNKSIELLGCSLDELKLYIENKFSDKMSWDELKNGNIHIDHIIPCASFDLTDPEQQKKCFHYTNLQPLWAIDNLRKGKKIA